MAAKEKSIRAAELAATDRCLQRELAVLGCIGFQPLVGDRSRLRGSFRQQ